ncbi:pentatricopeptide repeat-containing protein At5g39710 [Sesamum indicum]|uniref:Pentatricopeptide repeat-containing protein At5g39710 n=1 Tax=Sesamum indicum TaxID=4182 RepID=A0A6I9TR52_SESIN|nr:pentatricopeptide repeat-containing protein At5g39710 [Sesamum indicum]XP_011083672.1 pentatricopeptide repeat-containing protein At5g39710 [Sesamum indicum]
MNLRRFFRRSTVTKISKLHGRGLSSYSSGYRFGAITSSCVPPLFHPSGSYHASCFGGGPKNPIFHKPLCRYIHTVQQVNLNDSSSNVELESENDATMNEFLSRFVWIMRKKLSEVYPDCDKNTIDGMLLIIVEKVVSEMEKGGLEQMTGSAASTPSEDFSEDLWRTVWDVSNVVLQDMEKEKKKEKMKIFLQSEEVKEMYRFAGEVGIRGDMLRELRFKWARQKMEESEFHESLERLRKEEAQTESPGQEHLRKEIAVGEEGVGDNDNVAEDKQKIVSLPKRHGKIKYKIYGLDLSEPKWAEVADKVHKSGEVMWPQEPKPISGRCKLVADKILSLQEADDPAPLLGEWIGLLQPSRVDWIAFLDRLKEQNPHIYFKIAELVLGEESFEANVRDYSKLIDALAKENRLEDAERILTKMNENGILPDVITLTIVVHMYCKSGNLDRAKEAFESLRAHGFQPDMKVYNSMIMAHVNAGQPKLGESLMREMETRDIKPTKEIYMALLQSFAQVGDVNGADRISTTMQFAGFQPSQESCALMVEACERAGNLDQARHNFDQMMKLGHKPDDRCTASMIAAYEKKNLLDKALNLLLELEKDGIEPGVATYTVLVDWFNKLELFDEVEQILDKIAEQGEAPPLKLHISLCDMYIKSGAEKKALQALGVLESKIEQLESADFEKIIYSLKAGGFVEDARRIHGMMEARGFVLSEPLKVALTASRAVGTSHRSNKYSPEKR